MALISLQQMYDAWKRVSDWVSGTNATDKPKVTVDNFPATQNVALTGSNVPETQAVPTKNIGQFMELVTTSTTVTPGAFYISATQTLDRGMYIYPFYRLSVAKLSDLRIQWKDGSNNNIATHTLLSSLARIGDVCKDEIYTNKFSIVVSNNDTVDITLSRAGYRVV